MEKKKQKYKYMNVKVKPPTYETLLRTQAIYQLEEGKRVSMDDVISTLLDSLPNVNVTFDSSEEPDKNAKKKKKKN